MLSIVGTYIESLMIGRGTPPPPCSLCSRFCRPLDSGLSGRVGLGARNEGWTEGERLKSGKTVLGREGGQGWVAEDGPERKLLPVGLEWEESMNPCDSRKRVDLGEVSRLWLSSLLLTTR